MLNAEDPVVAGYAGLGRRPRSCTGVSGRCPAASASSTAGSWRPASSGCRSRAAGRRPPDPAAGSCRPAELAIPGAHNVSNALAAIGAALAFGVAPDAIRAAAAAFSGVEHRLEPVALIDGVRFINDSQGTQPDAVVAALRAFEPPVVLIAGGRDKGIDLDTLGGVVAERVAAAVLIGESGPTLEARFREAGLERTERAADLDDAVRRADAIARDLLATSGAARRRRRPSC